jgi:tetratricopeptide (TPR) repeat protein
MGNFKEGLIFALEGLKLSDKTDSTMAPGFTYSILARIYAANGEIKRSEHYLNKLIMTMPSENAAHPWIRLALTKAVFYAGSGQWDSANRYFKQCFDEYKIPTGLNRDIIEAKRYFAWALEKQGRYAEAKLQLDDVTKAYQEAKERFEKLNVQSFLIMRQNVVVGEEVEVRLDLVNISTNQGRLVKVDGLCSPSCRVVSLSHLFKANNGSIVLNEKPIGSFQIVTINMTLVFHEDGTFKFEPLVFYADNSGIMKCTKADPLIITVKAPPSKHKLEKIPLPSQNHFAFNFREAEKAYNFLLNAFEEDIVRAKLSQQDAGWRTLMEIVRNSQVSKHSMYGQSGRGGAAKQELSYLGLIEVQFFIGERGRGGRVLKIRVCCENDFVKKALRDRQIELV